MKNELKAVATEGAPKAIGPYSQAMIAGEFVFISGQIPLDPATGQLVAGDFKTQTERVLASLDAILLAAGCTRSNVVKTTFYLTDISRFSEFNEIYAKYFGDHHPARAAVGVNALPRGAEVEIEAIAVRG